MQTEPVRTERLLDCGWSLIGRLHQWLSVRPLGSTDPGELSRLICDVQILWASADDLNLKRLARTCLAIEQFLERCCATRVEPEAILRAEITLGIAGLQDLLLGLEATREEPGFSNLASLCELERRVHTGQWSTTHRTDDATSEPEIGAPLAMICSEPAAHSGVISSSELIIDGTVEDSNPVVFANRIDLSMLSMLEEFAVKVDETCQRLHENVSRDEAPYATTTSRLEHLAKTTRQLVEEMTQSIRGNNVPDVGDHLEDATFSDRLIVNPVPLTSFAIEQNLALPQIHPIESTPTMLPGVSLNAGTSEFRKDNRSMIENLQPSYEMPLETYVAVSPRVLIVDESLFFRHLIGLALRSSGYECEALDPLKYDHGSLPNATSVEAILVSSNVSVELARLISDLRLSHHKTVVGLTMYDTDECSCEVDAKVMKTQLGQLVAVLDELLETSQANERKIA